MITIEKIYTDLCKATEGNCDVAKLLKLKEDIAQTIRENTCYKTTAKTRVNAIKRVASKDDCRPVLNGYGVYNDYKVVTDSYHLIAIKEDNIPLKPVVNDIEKEKKLGKENCIFGTYPNVQNIIDFNIDKNENYIEYKKFDLNDIEAFYKMNKSKGPREALYEIGDITCSIIYLKNVIDVIGEKFKMYVPKDNYNRPIYIINDKKEIGLVLPVKIY